MRAVGSTGVLPTYRLNRRDAEQVTRSILLLSEALLTAGAHTVYLPFAGRGPVHDGDGLRRARAIPSDMTSPWPPSTSWERPD